MFAALSALSARLGRPQAVLPAIRVSSSGFAVRELAVPWEAVTRVKACRTGGPAWHDIRIEIGADIAQGGGIVGISLLEAQRGFDDFVAMADRKLTFPLGWWDTLAWPGAGKQAAALTLFERYARH